MSKFIFIFMIFSITIFGGVHEEYERKLKQIENQTQQRMTKDYSTAGMRNATAEEYEEMDKLLNKYYQKLMSRLDKEQKEALKKSQIEWIKFRDAELNFSNSLYSKMDGTIWTLSTPANAVELVKNRTEELVNYLAAFD